MEDLILESPPPSSLLSRLLNYSSPRCSTIKHIYSDYDCFKSIAIHLINIGLIAGSLIVQLPQILIVLYTRSVVGLSETSFMLQAIAGQVFLLYNIAESVTFRAYGETASIVIQNLILTLLCWMYGTQRKTGRMMKAPIRLLFLITFIGGTVVTRSTLWKPQWNQCLGLIPLPFVFLGKLPQILQNYNQKHTGQLSAITYFLMVSGNAARIVTTAAILANTKPIILMTHLLAFLSNFCVLFQIFYYWRATQDVLGSKKKR